MAKFISRNLTVTRVSYCVVEVQDKVPIIVPRTDAVFRGIIENRDRIMKLLKEREGKDANIIITDIKGGSNRYTISLEDFVLNANIVGDAAGDTENGDDEDEDGLGGDDADDGSGEAPNEQNAGGDSYDEPGDKEEDKPTDGGEDSTNGSDGDGSGCDIPATTASTADGHFSINKASQPKPWY